MALLGRPNWLVWHRRLGLVTCIGVLLWGLSGLTHPIMTRLQPKPAAFSAPSQHIMIDGLQDPATVLEAHGITHVQRLSMAAIEGDSYFRVSTDTRRPARYFAVTDGQELVSGDERHARALASHYTGLPASRIVDARFVTRFSDDYHSVNRLLPVWRVRFSGDDGLRAFIDTDQGKLATLVDNTRYTMTTLFRFGHNWAFAESMPRLQLGIMAIVLGIALLSAASGIYLYIRQRRVAKPHLVSQRLAERPLRRWHRSLGLLVAISTLLFAGSGMLHLFMSYKQEHAVMPDRLADIPASLLSERAWRQLESQHLSRIDLVSDGRHAYWLLRDAPIRSQVAALSQAPQAAQESHAHVHHHATAAMPGPRLVPAGDAFAGTDDIMQLAQRWAMDYAGASPGAVQSAEMVNAFGGEYGFLFKRLPVVKVQFEDAGNPRYYIDPANGILAAKVTDAEAAEGWIFAYLHKWNFADANKDLRDLLVMTFALGNVVVALLGLVMFLRQPRPIRRMNSLRT